MQLPHALNLSQARSYVAALADRATTSQSSSAYERVLIELDRMHLDDCPALDTSGLTGDLEVLFAAASYSIEDLVNHGVDLLSVELILAMLSDAHDLEVG